MIKISISNELAAGHPEFMAGCAERGHRVEVFGEATVGSTVGDGRRDGVGLKADEDRASRRAAKPGSGGTRQPRRRSVRASSSAPFSRA
jgi:hypothetical protein